MYNTLLSPIYKSLSHTSTTYIFIYKILITTFPHLMCAIELCRTESYYLYYTRHIFQIYNRVTITTEIIIYHKFYFRHIIHYLFKCIFPIYANPLSVILLTT